MADAVPTGPLPSGGAIREAGALHAPPEVAGEAGGTAGCPRGGLEAGEGAEAVAEVAAGAAGVAVAVVAVVVEAGEVVVAVAAGAEVATGGGRPR